MVGPSNASNRFGSSSYVVGTPANGLGNGVNFTSIQAAIDQAVLDGHGPLNPTSIFIRPGFYTEDLNITDGGLALVAAEAVAGGSVFISGLMTLTVSAAANAFSFANITFQNSAAPTVYITGAAFPIRAAFTNCSINCSDPGSTALEIDVPSGTFGFLNFYDCFMSSNGNCIYNNSRTIAILSRCSLFSTSGSAVVLDSTGRVQSSFSTLTSNAAYGILFNAVGNQANVFDCVISSALEAIETTVGGSVNISATSISTSTGSGFWISGTANVSYADILNSGTAIALDPGLGVITVPDWKPYGEAGAAPGTGLVRGTACFDSAQFTVTDGFVQSTISGLFPWVEQNASVTVNPNEGNFTVAVITLTLPAQPQPIGTTCKFKVVTNDQLIIAGQPGDVLQLGNQSGTTITSTSSGDAIELTHYDLGIWIANSAIGNFVVA